MSIRQLCIIAFVAMLVGINSAGTPPGALAAGYPLLARGQTVYVPVYSNIFTAPREVPVHLANILAIRNTDLHHAIQVTSADYYDTKGVLVKRYYQTPVTLAPLETTYVYLSQQDQAGGFGANFIVRWQAAREVNVPVIECLMVGSEGRSFVSPGQPIREETR